MPNISRHRRDHTRLPLTRFQSHVPTPADSRMKLKRSTLACNSSCSRCSAPPIFNWGSDTLPLRGADFLLRPLGRLRLALDSRKDNPAGSSLGKVYVGFPLRGTT